MFNSKKNKLLPKDKLKRIIGILVPVGLTSLMATFEKPLLDKKGITWLPLSTEDIISNIQNADKYTNNSASSVANVFPVVVEAIEKYINNHPSTINFIIFTSDMLLMKYIGIKAASLGIFIPSLVMLKTIISHAFDALAEDILGKVSESKNVEKFKLMFVTDVEHEDEHIKECIECKEQITSELTEMIDARSKFQYEYRDACAEYDTIEQLKLNILSRLELREMIN
jgi:hypothetical protein